MREAAIPLVAAGAYFFVVHRWASDEFARDRRLSRSAAAAVGMAFFLLTALVVVASAGAVLSIDLPQLPSLLAGGALAGVGLTIMTAALNALGSRERALGIRIDRLVTHGPYRFSRHPFYFAWWLTLFGSAVAGRSGLALGLAALTVPALVRISVGEERRLKDEHGTAYEDYRRQARALVGRRRPRSSG